MINIIIVLAVVALFILVLCLSLQVKKLNEVHIVEEISLRNFNKCVII